MSKMKKAFIGVSLFVSIGFASIFDMELDCTLMGKVSEFQGHYYGISSYPMAYEEALILTESTNAYLAIPDNKEENEFLQSLLQSQNIEYGAFIGIYDSFYTANYCFSNDKCVFDDSRFRTIFNKPMYYKNWAEQEPNNQADESGKDFSKFKGEHYVILQTADGKWADVGFERRFNAIFEFDKKSNCFIQIDAGEKE